MAEPLGPPIPPPRGMNAMNKWLTSLARDVPKELRRSGKVRRQIRRGTR